MTLDGKVDAAKWVTGLNAPKGMRALEDTLWVACLDELETNALVFSYEHRVLVERS